MSQTIEYIGEWSLSDLVDPRGRAFEEEVAANTVELDSWPISWTRRKVGLMSNKKPNADAMLDEVKRGLLAAAPDLTFVYGSKEPLAEGAPQNVIDELSDCDFVMLASAECGGCTSWVCRDYLSLEERGVPCMVIATNRFEKLARAVLLTGRVANPHLVVPQHPVSGITAEQAQAKIRGLMGQITTEVLGSESGHAEMKMETV